MLKKYVYKLCIRYFKVYIRPTDRVLHVDPGGGMLPHLSSIPSHAAITSTPTVTDLPGLPSRPVASGSPPPCVEPHPAGDTEPASPPPPADPCPPWIPFEEARTQTWDYIILHGAIHHYEDILTHLKAVRSLSQPETRVLVTWYSFLWSPLARLASCLGLRERGLHSNWITKEDLGNFARLAGFRVLTHTSRILLPLWLPLVSWFFNRGLSQMPLLRDLNLLHMECWRPVPVSPAEPHTAAPSVSVVIPARNEAGNIEAAFLRVPPMGPRDELIFVEGNSTDNTWAEIQRCAEKYAHRDRRTIQIAQQDGKGKKDAVYKGFAMAQNEILMILDADLTVPPESLPMFYEAITQGHAEFANGTRLVYKMEDEAMRFLNTLGNKFFAAAFSFVLGQPLRDTLCGTKVFTRASYARIEAHREYFGDFDPFGDFDLLFGASRLGLEIVEVPIRYQARTYGDTNISRFRHGLILFRMLWFAARKLRFV